MKKNKGAWGHLSKSGEVNGTPSILLKIASIILLYIACTHEHIPSGMWNEACAMGVGES